ncbi:NADH dehydrogenase [ubiquinone] 1 beta subcomplex subunit 9 isoform 3 [Schistosoma japonicum]|uniref:NADH dehydrogenase [ubiquinone] 1 beta subcomplex subunit 9 n=2 Tax=Schistosoma japonicum TaxID=6182 RepID=A0A4Z2DSM0_SCHJA|nr:mitochondrial electron transport nadh to ubiquinone [Schistosoma japonicum]KAH8866643.1 mitochondrial electron transport nadh to ubiquinone [Schistosoma japonicum]KAH8866648.1 mitochondrial electron transport nadh to ubiquinone [Schistosoma japonicum]TNN19190.1 NADH dehydrogenase [ubiquinone] 1 beta subcomplex subunit 9 isoform 3 [Schistosoma japonicum]
MKKSVSLNKSIEKILDIPSACYDINGTNPGMSVSTVPPHLRSRLISHGQKVCQLYKAALNDLKSKHSTILDYRYHAVLIRARFEENRNIKDEILARKLVEDGWNEFERVRSTFQFKYPTSPKGAAFQREPSFEDCLYDTWHPLEKQQYPDYFARREKRKKKFIEAWVKRYGSEDEKVF